jgi:hypothetical protein
MVARTPAQSTARFIIAVVTLLLPSLSLVALGGLYLWEKGWVIWWALAALAMVGTSTLLLRWALPAPDNRAAGSTPEERAALRAGYESPLERRAWADVRAIAASASVESLTSFATLSALAQRTIEAVAARMHPEKRDAIWQFTLPESLAITERVSTRLRLLAATRIPFGDRLTMAQLIATYRWRHMIGVAERAYDVWRVIRLANPAAAATQEARERMSRAMLVWGREHVARRLVEAYVEEVGRAAIDLYSGRFFLASTRLESGVGDAPSTLEGEPTPGATPAAVPAGAPSALVLGSSACRDTVFDALDRTNHLRPYQGRPAPLAAIERSTAVSARAVGRRQLLRDTSTADIIVWIIDRETGPLASDLEALAALRTHYERATRMLPPALALVIISPEVDAPGDPVSVAGLLASGLAAPLDSCAQPAPDPTPPPIVTMSSAPAALSRDGERLLDALEQLRPTASRVRALREREQLRNRSGMISAGRQAISAAGSLTAALWKSSRGGGA